MGCTSNRTNDSSQVGPGVVFGPRKLTIVAYAVDTETQIGKLKLNDFPAGDWLSGRKVKGDPVVQTNRAGIAISPDGRRISLLNPSRDALTTVNAENLRVISEVRVTQQQSFLGGLADRLGLTVQTAAAKAQQGYSAWIKYSPDGMRLYEEGYVQTIGRNGKFSNRSTGLQVIDATTGRVIAERSDPPVDGLAVAPDGSAVYTVAQPTIGGVGTVSRLDPVTLAITAQRTFQPAEVGAPVPLVAPAKSLTCGAASPSQGIATQGSAPDGSLWALGLGGLTAQRSTKIVWRMTGSGDLRMYAEAADGTRITPDWGPELHTGGSSWSGYNPPGDDYGSGWTFPKAGCWRIHAARDNVAGDIWFNVGS